VRDRPRHGRTVTSIDVATEAPEPAIHGGGSPASVAVSPDGKTVWVTIQGANTVVPIDAASDVAAVPVVNTRSRRMGGPCT